MVHQWTFTLFYVLSELWGDVILSLNFWVLANETTDHKVSPHPTVSQPNPSRTTL